MSQIKRIYGDPENSVFAVKGELVSNELGEVYIKKFNSKLNTGWLKLPSPQEIQFEKIEIEANSIGGLSNLSPTLRFEVSSGSAIIKIEAEVSSSVSSSIRAVLNGETVINEVSSSAGEYLSNELPEGIYSVICTADTGVDDAFVRLTVSKVGGYGRPFVAAQALGEISATKEVVLKVFGTNYYSKGKARFFDVTTNSIATGSNYEYNLQTDTINNPADFAGGGLKVFMGKGAGAYEGRGRVEIADFGGDFINVNDLTQSLFWLEEPNQDTVVSSFTQGSEGNDFYKLVNPNNFAVDVDYTISLSDGATITTGSDQSNNYFNDNVLVLNSTSATLAALSTSSFTASYDGTSVLGEASLFIGGVEGSYPLIYKQNVVPAPTTTTTAAPTTTTVAPTTTTAAPTTTTAAPEFTLQVNGGQPGIAGVSGTGEYAAGTEVEIEAFLLAGWVFNVWSDPGAELVQPNSGSNPGTITMPAENVLVTATATEITTTTPAPTTTTAAPTTTTAAPTTTTAAPLPCICYELSYDASGDIDLTWTNCGSAVGSFDGSTGAVSGTPLGVHGYACVQDGEIMGTGEFTAVDPEQSCSNNGDCD